jgi:hypothetical protein
MTIVLMVWSFLKSPLGRWIAIGAVVLVFLLGARAHYLREGRRQGLETGHVEASQQIEQVRAQAALSLEATAAQAKASIAAADQRTAAVMTQLAQYAATLKQLAQAKQVADEKVNALPDASLHAYVKQTLGLSADPTDDYTAPEERQLARCVTDLPACQQQLGVMQKAAGAQEEKTAAAEDRATALAKQLDATQQYGRSLYTDYARLYNLQAPKYRSGRCMFLWHCGRRTIPVAAPETLKPPS